MSMKKKKIENGWLNKALFGIVAVLLVGGYAQASVQKSALVFDYPDESTWIKPTVLGDEDKTENKQENVRENEQKREEENKRETEIETQDGQKIKTKIEDDGTTKVEIEQDDLKIKYEVKNGEINSVEDDEVESEEESEIEDEIEDNEVELSTERERHTVRLNGVTARTNFPLSIDVATNELIVATKDGPKEVTVLPDQAVLNLLATGIVDEVGERNELELQVQNGEPV